MIHGSLCLLFTVNRSLGKLMSVDCSKAHSYHPIVGIDEQVSVTFSARQIKNYGAIHHNAKISDL